jgi:hypothetical protein
MKSPLADKKKTPYINFIGVSRLLLDKIDIPNLLYLEQTDVAASKTIQESAKLAFHDIKILAASRAFEVCCFIILVKAAHRNALTIVDSAVLTA